MVYNRRRSA